MLMLILLSSLLSIKDLNNVTIYDDLGYGST